MAVTIAANAPIAVRAAKKVINDGLQVDIDVKAIVIEEKLLAAVLKLMTRRKAWVHLWKRKIKEIY